MMTVLITGGTGLIGKALSAALSEKGHKVIILTRNPKKKPFGNISYASWNIERQLIDSEAIKSADAIIHLAGENVGKGKWTEERKREIVTSRVESSKLLIKALKEIPNKVNTVISASAIGWYGSDPQVPNNKPFVETMLPSKDFLGKVCEEWENAVIPVLALHKRLVILRTGIVLSAEGGVYKELKKGSRFGLMPILGSGNQVISWIHINDLVRMYMAALENQQWQGTYNAVAPEPISNKNMVLAISRQRKGMSIPVHVPKLFLQMLLGEMSVEVLKSTTVSSWKSEGEGFQFLYPSIEAAVRKLEDQ